MQDDEVLDRLLRGADPARRLHPDDAAGLVVDVADRLEHAERHGQRRGGVDLAGRRLDEVGAGGHREQRRAADVVVRAELAGLEDHLQVRGAAGLLHLDDLVVDLGVAAGEERAAVDHHVDLVGAERNRLTHIRELDRERRLAGRERGRDRSHLHAGSVEPRLRGRDEIRIDADRRDRRDRRVDRVGPHRLRAERGDLAGRVGALERRQVHHPDGEVVGLQLRVLLDRALGQRRGALLERDGVDGADPRESRLERELEAAGQCRSLRHGTKCSRGLESGPMGNQMAHEMARARWRRTDRGPAGSRAASAAAASPCRWGRPAAAGSA